MSATLLRDIMLAAGLSGIMLAATAQAQDDARSYRIPAAAEQTAIALREQALDSDLPYELTASLTTEVGQRLAGSPEDARAVAWAVAKLKALGFDKVWTEPFEIEGWRRGAETAAIVAPFPQELIVAALGKSVATPPEGITAQVAMFHNVEALQRAKRADVEGKIVYLARRMRRTQDGSDYGLDVRMRALGPSEAAKLGAKAVVIRSVGTDSHRLPHTGALRYEDGVAKIPAAALSNPDADQLERILAYGEPVALKLVLTPESIGKVVTHNVIGEFTGRAKPGELVVLGAHLDSWDLGTGAIDDAAGVGVVTAAAKMIGDLPKSKRPARSIRVVLFGAEELGLYGARAYADAHKADAPNHAIAAESDFGAGQIWQVSSGVGEKALPAFKAIVGLMSPLGVHYGDNSSTGDSDVSALHPLGVPMAGLSQDGSEYFDLHHTADDTLDKVDPADLAQNAAAYAVFAYLAAELGVDFRAQ